MANLRDADILQEYSVWINDVGKIGTCPSFQPPELNIQVEEFRGGGMDGTIEMPFGLDKIEFDFELHSWDTQPLRLLGYGPGSLDVPITFRGYLMTANVGNIGGGTGQVGQSFGEKPLVIETRSLIKSVKPSKVEPGKKTVMTISVVANYYKQTVEDEVVAEIDVFNKQFVIDGVDRTAAARRFLGFTY